MGRYVKTSIEKIGGKEVTRETKPNITTTKNQ